MSPALARLRHLIADTSATDAADRRPPYAILATFSGHILLPLVTAILARAWGASPAGATMIAFAIWVGIWEGVQYARARLSGLSRWGVLRDWWLHDAWAYGCGLAVQGAVMLGAGPLSTTLVVAGAGLSAVAAAVIWGRVPKVISTEGHP